MSRERLAVLEDRACPGAGACGGQYTANTMSVAVTLLGLSPMGASEVAAVIRPSSTRRGGAASSSCR